MATKQIGLDMSLSLANNHVHLMVNITHTDKHNYYHEFKPPQHFPVDES